MQKLKTVQQRVFCVFLRPYQRISGTDPRGKMSDKLIEVEIDSMAWYDPTQCSPCPDDGGNNCPALPKQFRPIGPSNLVEGGGSDLISITDPASTRQLKYHKKALQFYSYKTEDLNEIGEIKPIVQTNSRTLQPFNEDMMFTEDIWFLHSTWTSFEKTKLIVRQLVDAFGFDSVMITAYIPLGMNLLPDK